MAGSQINTYKIPAAFWVWYKELEEKYPYTTIEVGSQEVLVCRGRTPVKDEKAIEDLPFGKFIKDESGCFIERTFWPKYHAGEDIVKPV